MAGPADGKFRITFTAGRNDDDRRDTLLGDGPLCVDGAMHYLAVALPAEVTTDDGG